MAGVEVEERATRRTRHSGTLSGMGEERRLITDGRTTGALRDVSAGLALVRAHEADRRD